MNKQELVNLIFKKKTFLCVGLDTDVKKIPQHLLKAEDPIFEFNKAIIDATAPYCVAYKPNLAFTSSNRSSFSHVNNSTLRSNVLPSESKKVFVTTSFVRPT